MNDKFFGSPVFVKDGQFTIAEIASIADALDFLDEWPLELQDILIRRRSGSATLLTMAAIHSMQLVMPLPSGQGPQISWKTSLRFRPG